MTPAQQLKQIFGADFQAQESIQKLRQFRAPNSYCLDKNGAITGIFASEIAVSEVSIPKSLKQLEYLNLSDNETLETIIFEGGFSKLWHLDLSDCRIKELKLPVGFESLRWLDLSRNQLQKFVPAGKYEKLKYLDLSGNQLNDFPTSLLSKFTSLEGLYLKENDNFPSTKITSINKQGNALEFLQRFARELEKGATINKEYKVLLVGNGGVGKTCLVERLVYDSFEQKHLSTHGIALEQYAKEDFPYILNLWDFGGQDIYHATHRLFMQSNAIYLALWDQETLIKDKSIIEEGGEDREYENFSLQYWLHYIQHQGGKSPVIVVKTKSKTDNTFHPKQQEIQRKYGISEFIQIDSEIDDGTENGFDRLLFLIKESIIRLRQKQELPQNWADLRQHLRTLLKKGIKTISVDTFLEIASEYQVEEPMEVLTDWLVTSGVVFYRKRNFEEAIFLDQGWAIEAIYAIFNREQNHYYWLKEKQKGNFSGKDLNKIWAIKNYSPSEKELLVNFMLGCELCFELKKEEDKYLSFEKRQFFSPQMMPDTEPPSVNLFLNMIQDNQLLHARYSHTFLHDGIIQSFIVRTQSLADVKDIWRYGILLQEEGAYAIVRAVKKSIHVISTKVNLVLFEKVRNTLESIQGEQVEEFVSLNGIDFVSMKTLKASNQEFVPAENNTLVPRKDLSIFIDRKTQDKFPLSQGQETSKTSIQKMEREQLFRKNEPIQEATLKLEKLPATILFLQANPTREAISWEKEFSHISGKLDKEKFVLIQEKDVNLEEIIEAIDDHEPEIIHFCGHGKESETEKGSFAKEEGGLIVHNEAKNEGVLLDADLLERQFKEFKRSCSTIELVLLNACHSQEQALAISKAGIYTLGTTDEIISEAARKFAAGFYRKLTKTNDLYAAIQFGISMAVNTDEEIRDLIRLYHNGNLLFPKPQ